MSLAYLPTGYLTYKHIYHCFSSQDNAPRAHPPASSRQLLTAPIFFPCISLCLIHDKTS